MSIATTSLKYGWKVLAILTIGAGSIFVADNVLNRITTKDRIEITLAVVERCLATQTGTNPATYGVDPLSIVRTWTDTNGASVTMTNALEWRDDLSMKVELDAKLEALCPYYVDPDSVYDGTTNIVMHTFTGLLTSLDLGDHTNFTAIPAIGTNIATYGPWAWRNYVVAWQERYKVLEALKMTKDNSYYRTGRAASYFMGTNNLDTWADAQDDCLNRPRIVEGYGGGYLAQTNNPFPAQYFEAYTAGIMDDIAYATNYYATMVRRAGYMGIKMNPTNIPYVASLYLQAINGPFQWGSGSGTELHTFDDFGEGASMTYEVQQTRSDGLWFNFGNTNYPAVTWCNEPTRDLGQTRGYSVHRWDIFVTWQFNYCTNKYW